jgi:alpha-tubulin suppressor-like RCC1 family protein
VAFTGFIPVTGGQAHAIAAGIAHTCAITPEGGVQCWGNNNFGQLGDGSNKGSNVPVNVVGISGGKTIVAGGNHTCVLTGSDVWCWGQNSKGQLGDGSTTDRNIPVKVLSNVTDITAGLDYTCAIMTYGQVMCWGNNDKGQLANGTKTDSAVPTLASLITGISNVDAGQDKSCGLTGAGLLRCVNKSNAQDLGKVSPNTAQPPLTTLEVAVNRFGTIVLALNGNGEAIVFQGGKFQTVNNVTQATDVDSGVGHMCALLMDGTVKCWGQNSFGQLGINSQANSVDPQQVKGVSAAWQLAVGKNHACVLITSSTPGIDDIQCWGLNTDGQLGNGTNQNSMVPVYVK